MLVNKRCFTLLTNHFCCYDNHLFSVPLSALFSVNSVKNWKLPNLPRCAHGGSFQYDSRAPSRVTSIGFTPMEGMPFQYVLKNKIHAPQSGVLSLLRVRISITIDIIMSRVLLQTIPTRNSAFGFNVGVHPPAIALKMQTYLESTIKRSYTWDYFPFGVTALARMLAMAEAFPPQT